MTPDIHMKDIKILADQHYTLRNYTFDYVSKDGTVQQQQREVFDRGNSATILLYHPARQTVILTRQFRLPTFVNGNPTGMMIEACAGLLEQEDPETCILRETEEETGYRLPQVKKIFEAYMSPGAVTEVIHFFVGAYSQEMKVRAGGGADETENVEVLELPFKEALKMMAAGEIRDAKAIMLLQYAGLHRLLEV